MSVIEIENVHKSYFLPGAEPVSVLKGVSLTIGEGELVAVVGRSGSGKSSFMNILGTLDLPTSGHYRLNGTDVSELNDGELAALRNKTIGFVFQNFNLIPRRTVLDNVCMPLLYADVPKAKRRQMAQSYLEMVGLGDYGQRLPNQLSGGQQQRVAIARSMVNAPKILLADEPTGNLDSKTAEDIMELFTTINGANITVILVTHDLKTAGYARRVIRFQDGLVAE